MPRPIVAGNWKMNGTRASVRELVAGVRAGLAGLEAVDVVVCPSFPFLADVADAAAGSALALGAQNVADYDEGAYTGEVSAAMLAEFDVSYAIVGHSERRQLYGETDAQVAERFAAARRNGLRPILCVGETLEEREAGQTEAVVARQLGAVLDHQGAEAFETAVIAYEPVWAIGTGVTAAPEQAQAVHAFIRGQVAGAQVPILYGGSMKADNAEGLLAMPDIDGGLIGGASLKADEFLTICRAAARR